MFKVGGCCIEFWPVSQVDACGLLPLFVDTTNVRLGIILASRLHEISDSNNGEMHLMHLRKQTPGKLNVQ